MRAHPIHRPLLALAAVAALAALALLQGSRPLAAEEPPAPAPTPSTPTPSTPAPAAPEASPVRAPAHPSALEATLEAVRQPGGGSLGEHAVKASLRLANPGEAALAVRRGSLWLRSAGGWLTLLPDAGLVPGPLEVPARGELTLGMAEPLRVLGPALDALAVLEAGDGFVAASAALAEAGAPTARKAAPAPWPLGLGVHGRLDAVPYADGRRSIVVVGQVQLLAGGTLSDVEGSATVGDGSAAGFPQAWTGGVEDGAGPALWPFVQRLDVPPDFHGGTVSLRLKARLDGEPVSAALDLPVSSVEPFTCRGPVLDQWQLANGPAEGRAHANLLQLRSRYAYHFVVLKDGQTYEGDVSDNRSYFAWDKSVVAVADGDVVDFCDHQPDRSGAESAAAVCVFTPVNRIVLKHADGTYTAYLHLKQHSASHLRIAKGTHVRAGQPIARVGNSGASSEPHLLFYAFRPEADGTLTPVPVAFSNAFSDRRGSTPVTGVPEGGSQVHFLDTRVTAPRPAR